MNNIQKTIDEINEKYIPTIYKILKLNASNFIDIKISSPEDDMKKATDFNIEIVGGTVAVRIRFDEKRSGKIYRDFTIRSRSRYGQKTEIHKLRDGFAKWYLYIWHRIDGGIDWMLVDMDNVRESGLLDSPRQEISNGDGTCFIYITIDELQKHGCIVDKQRWNKSAWYLLSFLPTLL